MSLKLPRKLSIILLAAAALILLPAGCSQTRLIEIQPPPDDSDNFGQVYIGGEVAVPGLYPLKEGDTLEALLQAAGGSYGGNDLLQR
jgi:competence protein ComEA